MTYPILIGKWQGSFDSEDSIKQTYAIYLALRMYKRMVWRENGSIGVAP